MDGGLFTYIHSQAMGAVMTPGGTTMTEEGVIIESDMGTSSLPPLPPSLPTLPFLLPILTPSFLPPSLPPSFNS